MIKLFFGIFAVSLLINLIPIFRTIYLGDLGNLSPFLENLISWAGIISGISFFILIYLIFRNYRKKAKETASNDKNDESVDMKQFEGEEFHNDFSKVPGGQEVGTTNSPRPMNQVIQVDILYGKEDLVGEDLAKIGVVEKDKSK